MSYEEFRRRIDTARNILVGAVPSPAGQIDQITYALIYKFMNDIDDKSASLGGKRSYFTGDYEKYNWNNLMSPSLGAHERLELYRQAVQSMTKNPNLPPMFAEIYQNAFLPFNSANVLTLFLKEIDKFSHGESDDIGDAYEYLLSITGAQGDVGQFRTPRHIIEFVVNAVNPDKDDSVLDPACGTAGFLIKAYEHVMAQHDGKDTHGNTNDEKRLTASELEKIHHNYHGFDIDPTMVRTAKVNMYLHGFTSPDIINHDSLSDEKYWEKRYDVILANPPFMTPKGGIQPHKKFSVSANRAEVLFVDYIMSHLNPVSGRAGIIVPEGIIFQSGKAYQQLRKNLIENSLYAVVSLPSGVFNPYAGVKTSILLLDKQLAKERDEVLFVKVENDGYSLGAQRRPIAGNQFPEALEALEQLRTGAEPTSQLAHTVKKSEIAESGDYNLSGDRYKVNELNANHNYQMVSLGDTKYFRIESGGTPSSKNDSFWNGDINWATLVDLPADNRITKVTSTKRKITEAGLKGSSAKLLPEGAILISSRATIGRIGIAQNCLTTNQGFKNVIIENEGAIPEYIANIMTSMTDTLKKFATGGTFSEFSKSSLENVKIPLPPLETQRQIVDELDGYQRIIDSATAIVKTYKPTIKINPAWELSSIGKIADVVSGQSPEGKYYNDNGDGVPFYQGKTEFTDKYIGEPRKWTTYTTKAAERGDVLISVRAPVGPVNISTTAICIGRGLAAIRTKDDSLLDQDYLYEAMRADEQAFKAKSSGSTFESINRKDIEEVKIPLPPIEEQKQIVADLEAEQKLIDANKKLITLYQQKIRTKIAEVWGE